MPADTSFRFVTGSEFGLSGAEQIRLALETISQNGGIATISQITTAVENTIAAHDPQCRLSPQGKASLRFFVNKVAVDMSTFIGVAQAWLQSPSGGQRGLNPQELKKWTGDQWKSRIQEHFDLDELISNEALSSIAAGLPRTLNLCQIEIG